MKTPAYRKRQPDFAGSLLDSLQLDTESWGLARREHVAAFLADTVRYLELVPRAKPAPVSLPGRSRAASLNAGCQNGQL